MSNAVQKHEPAEVETSNESAGNLVRFALERNVDPAVLERLVALQERVTERNARAAYFAAVSAFQNECPAIHKSKSVDYANRDGGQTSYRFAPLDKITEVIRPLLQKHGLSYSWDTEESQPGALAVVCVVRHVEGHSERSRFPVPTGTNAKMSEAQKMGAALTYGRRQSLVSVLGIIASDDVDGQDPPDVEPISEFQANEIEEKLRATGSDRARFLAFCEVDDVAKIPAGKFNMAVKLLDERAKKRAAS